MLTARETDKVSGRGDWIRTSDLPLPKRTRYQASLRPGPLDHTAEMPPVRYRCRMVTPPLVVTARSFGPPDPIVVSRWLRMRPCTVTGKSTEIPPCVVPA